MTRHGARAPGGAAARSSRSTLHRAGGGGGGGSLLAACAILLISVAAFADVPVATISGPHDVKEGADAATPRPVPYAVTLGSGLRGSTAIVIDYSVTGTATKEVDYTDAGGGKLTIAAGAASGTITINVLGDTMEEVGETLIVTLTGAATSAGTVAIGSPNRVVTTIRPAATAIVTAADVSAAEEDDEIAFTVTVPAGITDALEVAYATRDVTATAGADYTAQSGTLTIAGGTTGSVTVATVAIEDDKLYEGNEKLELTLRLVSPPANVALGNSVATGTITDNDALTVFIRTSESRIVEGSAATFEVGLEAGDPGYDAASAAAVVVEYEVTGLHPGTITAEDYEDPGAGTLTIPAGETSATFTIRTLADELLERPEGLRITLKRATTAAGTVRIRDRFSSTTGWVEDGGRAVGIEVMGATGPEGGNAVFEVKLSRVVAVDARFSYSTTNVTARSDGGDFTLKSNVPLTIPAGQTSARITVELTADDLAEKRERFTLRMNTASLPPGVDFTGPTPVGWITDGNILKASVKGPGTVPEGSPAVYTVELAGGVGSADVVVDYTVGGTATAGTDYTDPGEGKLTIAVIDPSLYSELRRTAATGSFTIQTRAVANEGAGETLVVTLTRAETANGTATVGTPAAATTAFTPEGTVTVSVAANQREVTEGTDATFDVELTGGANSKQLVVNYALGGTAAANDYTAPAATSLTFPADNSARTRSLTIATVDDTLEEAKETLTATVSLAGTPAGVKLGTPVATTAIVDGDTLTATVAANEQTVVEGANATFTVTLAGPTATPVITSTADVMVPYRVRVDGAVTGDVRKSSGVLTIPAGVATGVITVAVVDDDLSEAEETLSVALSGPTTRNGSVALGATTTASTTIPESDGGLRVSVSGAGTVNEGADAVFTIKLSGTVNQDITVTVTPQDADATDYNGAPGAVTLKAGKLSATFTVATTLDNLAEADENFEVTISDDAGGSLAANNVAIGVAKAAATIRDDDPLRVNLSGDQSVTEGSPATYTVELAGGLGSSDVVASWQAGSKASTATITAGASSGTFSVATQSGDAPGTLSVSLAGVNTGAGRVSRGTSSASTRIVGSNVDRVSVSAPAAAVVEANDIAFTVTRTGSNAGEVVVRYATASGTAGSADYDSASGTLTFTGAGSETVTVNVEDDTLAEDDETFSMALTLVSPQGGSVVLGTDRATATIDDDDALTATVTRLRETMLEGSDATFLVALTRTGGASASGSRPVIVSYRPTAASTAKAPDDYTSPSGKLTIPAGRSSGTITIRTRTDDVLELFIMSGTRGGETLAVELTAATTAAGTVTASATASQPTNIRDHGGFVEVSVADAAPVDEGEAAVFAVSLSRPVMYPVTMAVAATAATATTGDYGAAVPATLTFAAGETRATVTVQTMDDTFAEDEETFAVTLSSLAIISTPPTVLLNGTVALRASTATGTIRKNDPLRINLGGPRAVAESAAASVEYTLQFTGGTTDAGNDITVDYAYRVGAQSGTGTATITAPNQTGTASFAVAPANAPSVGETLVVTLTGVAAVRGTVTRGTSSVNTAVVREAISANEPTAGEGSALDFTITPSGNVYAVVSYRTGGGTASQPADYTAQSGTLTFGSSDGTTTTETSSAQTVTVPTRADTLNEGDETLDLRLSWVRGSAGVGIATPTVKGTITDAADDALTASVAVGQATVPEGSAATFVVTLTGATSTAPVVVGYDVGGTATAEDGDYAAASGTLTIGRGASTGTISIATREDRVLDRGETLSVTLLSATSAGAVALGTATASATIADYSEVAISIDDTTVVEGETATFTVDLTGKVAADVTVGYAAIAGPAGTTGATTNDYTAPAAGASLTVMAGETRATIKVATRDDLLAEADETFTVSLKDLPAGAPSGVVLWDREATATITHERPAPKVEGAGADGPALAASVSAPTPATVIEGQPATFTVSLTGGDNRSGVTVDWELGGEATAADYAGPSSGTLTIPENQDSGTITVTTEADGVPEPDETLSVTLTEAEAVGAGLAVVGSHATASVTIVDRHTGHDELSVSVTAPKTVAEGDVARFTVKVGGGESTAPVSVSYSLGGTAEGPADYTAPSPTMVSIPAGRQTATIAIQTRTDQVLEPDETLVLTLTGAATANGSVRVGSPKSATIAIQDPVYLSINRVNEALLPGITRAAAADALEAVSDRMALAARGEPPAASADLAGLTGLHRALQANERALQDGSYDLARVLGGSSFLVPLSAHDRESGVWAAVWGRGDFRAIDGGDGDADDVDWEGSVWSARLGADLRFVDNLLTGLALSWTGGGLDYVDELAPTDREGTYATWLIGAYPYVGWTTPRFGLWATGGIGIGGVSIDDSAASMAVQESDLSLWSVGAGASVTLLSTDDFMAGGTTALKLRADGFFGGGSVAENEAKTIRKLDVGVQQARAVVETSHAWHFPGGGSLKPVLEVGGRFDGGDGATGIGVEVGGGVTWADPGLGLTAAAGGRALVLRDNYGEWGLSGLLQLDASPAGHGLSMSVRPTWGVTASGVNGLWKHGAVDLPPGRRPGGRVEAEIGYGLPAFGMTGVLTPFAQAALTGAGARTLSLGGRLELGTAFDATLEAERSESADPHAAPVHDVKLEGSLRW